MVLRKSGLTKQVAFLAGSTVTVYCYIQQKVVITRVRSEWGDVTGEIPQGRILGPLLFVIHN